MASGQWEQHKNMVRPMASEGVVQKANNTEGVKYPESCTGTD
jgi:hypothetical protein